jgi:hypothetical protein
MVHNYCRTPFLEAGVSGDANRIMVSLPHTLCLLGQLRHVLRHGARVVAVSVYASRHRTLIQLWAPANLQVSMMMSPRLASVMHPEYVQKVRH